MMCLASGCTSLRPQGGFDRVDAMVAERTGARIRWDQGTAADSLVADTVRVLLAGDLTAERAVQVGLLRNRDLQALYEDLGIAQADLVQAGLFRNPVFSAGRIASGGPSDLGLLIPFVDLFVRPLRQRVAGAAFEAATLRVASGVVERATEIRGAFYRAQGALQLVELRAGVAAAARASAQSARAISAAGNIQDFDLATQQALAEQAQVDYDIAVADANVERQHLVRVLGVAGADTAFRLPNRLPALPAGDPPIDTLTSLAMRRRLDVAASVAQIQGAARAVGIARPLSILNDGRIGYEGEKEPGTGHWNAGVSVDIPIPIFDDGRAARFGAESRYRQALARHEALVLQVRSELRVAAVKLAAARRRAESYRSRIIPLRHRAVQEAERLSNAMAVSVFTLLQAKQSEIEAGQGYVEALRDYWESSAQLERAAGGTLPLPQPPMPAAALPDSQRPIDLLRDPRFVTAADTAPPAPGDTGMAGMNMAHGEKSAPAMKMAPGEKMPQTNPKAAAKPTARPVKKPAPAPRKPMDPAMKMPAGMKMPPAER